MAGALLACGALHADPFPPADACCFAAGTFDDFSRGQYSAELSAMGERSLEKPPAGHTRVRFLWLRSFHPAIAVRVERGPAETRLIAVALSPPGSDAPRSVVRREERVLSADEWTRIEALVSKAGFWKLPTSETSHGRDGAEWILEIAEPDRYHAVDRWNARELDAIGRRLLALSGLDVEPIY